ncbi:hypothetical protein [Cellulomonas dongxiuzhuiae]|uniref:hypothetical protein n=1 Tax=Cellulomonas dongxiuzhuiae TaxID=2819979 RepID=UPI001AAF460F|nr:hypothetical protein [Cellulomonas dongxiuzhuiae]MBO3087637.1 hypothetical protein [Cellulomonas dongxiuzhuiae]
MTTRTPTSRAAVLLRLWALLLVVAVPLAALMLTPTLMRSRAGGASGLSWVGITVFVLLCLALVPLSVSLASRVAPLEPDWPAGGGRRVSADLRTRHPRAWWRRLGELVGLLVVSQLAGCAVAAVLPYAYRVPARDGGSEWAIDYPAYATQAVVMYLVICFAAAWFAHRVRSLALDTGGAAGGDGQ